MDMEKAIDKILQQYEEYTDMIIGLSFVRSPFAENFRELVGLKNDADFLKAFEAFMAIAHDTFRWDDYLAARTTAEKAFRLFYEQQRYSEDKRENALNDFIVSFFNQNIDEPQFEWEDNHPDKDYSGLSDTEDDIDNLYLARVFSCISDLTDLSENTAFCESIGVRYNYEQLHMCCWFAGQITNGSGHYSRGTVNYSARTTYNRLLNPYSLLWIGVVLGADKEDLRAAAEERKARKPTLPSAALFVNMCPLIRSCNCIKS